MIPVLPVGQDTQEAETTYRKKTEQNITTGDTEDEITVRTVLNVEAAQR